MLFIFFISFEVYNPKMTSQFRFFGTPFIYDKCIQLTERELIIAFFDLKVKKKVGLMLI